MKFSIGDKVYVTGNWNFPDDCQGVISEPPQFAVKLVEDDHPWDGIRRFVKGRNGPIEFYWIKFNKPQFDSDGDGPYPEGEIDAEHLTLRQ